MDPLSGSPWSQAGTVAGFSQSPPNQVLMEFAARELLSATARAAAAGRAPRLLDLGCGAGRNALPLADQGWNVLGLDLSLPMAVATAERARAATSGAGTRGRADVVLAPMHDLPVRGGAFDVVLAHGIWNLARSDTEFRRAVREAARASAPGAALFVFTFSRNTLARDATPVPGETFVYTQFSGQPQVFLTEAQLMDELGAAGFSRDAGVPLTEYNLPKPGTLQRGRVPVIYECLFRFAG